MTAAGHSEGVILLQVITVLQAMWYFTRLAGHNTMQNLSLIFSRLQYRLQGGTAFHVYDTDMEAIFRQESYFHYLFGVEEEDYFGAIDIATGKTTLFMPRLPSSYAVWMGAIQVRLDTP